MDERETSTPQQDDPEAPLYSTVPLEDEDGNEYVIQQQNVGRENMEGGGEWPDPHTPPRAPAPGSAKVDGSVDDPPESESTATPTPHPGTPDRRTTSVIRDPSDEEIQEGISSPKVGP